MFPQTHERTLNTTVHCWRIAEELTESLRKTKLPVFTNRRDGRVRRTCFTERGDTSPVNGEATGGNPGCRPNLEGACETNDRQKLHYLFIASPHTRKYLG